MRERGFTLVELSIVLVIIGLLIGGILAAQSMIDTARVQTVIREVQQYQVMVNNFGTKYNSIPGDSTIFTPAGNGDGVLWNNLDTPINYRYEATNFWVHLKQAGMLQNCTCDGGLNGYATSTTTPASAYTKNARWAVGIPYSGSLSFQHGNVTKANYFELTTGGSYDNSFFNAQAIVKPANALAIDTKIDDGNPLNGEVLSTNNGTEGDQVGPWPPSNRYCINTSNGYYTGYNNDIWLCNGV